MMMNGDEKNKAESGGVMKYEFAQRFLQIGLKEENLLKWGEEGL